MMEQDIWDCDFEAFVRNLQVAGLITRNPQRRRDFIAKFRREIALVSLYLNELSVTGGSNEFHAGPPENCDFCNQPVAGFGFFVDGQTIGQLYKARENNTWQCVAGGEPSKPETKDS